MSVVLVLAAAGPALAQRENGPFSGLFVGQPDRDAVKWMDFHGSIGASFDENLIDDANTEATKDPRLWESGYSGGASGVLSFLRRSDTSEVTVTGAGKLQRYSVSPDMGAAVDFSAAARKQLGAKLSFTLKTLGHYSPFFQFAPFGGLDVGDSTLTPPTDFSLAAVADRNLFSQADAELVARFTKRTEIAFGASGQQWAFFDHADRNVRSWGGRAAIRHALTRALSAHFGYGRDQAGYQFEGARPIPNDTIDVGLDYGDELRFARRTTLSFQSSTSAIRLLGETHYRLNGRAGLSRGIGRTWTLGLHYSRATEFLPAYRLPLLSDSVSTSVGGMFHPRVRWTAAAGYTRGNIGFDTEDVLSWYTSSTTLAVSLTRLVGVSGQYRFYRYSSPPESAALDFEPRLTRQVFTVAMNVWLPILNVMRTPSDPR